jgi:hypothetical protein
MLLDAGRPARPEEGVYLRILIRAGSSYYYPAPYQYSVDPLDTCNATCIFILAT